MLGPENIHFRFATEEDAELYFNWANDDLVRKNSYNQKKLIYSDHLKWFQAKLRSQECFFYLFLNAKNEAIGQVRIDKVDNEVVIGISVDERSRGKSYSPEMLMQACNDYLKNHPQAVIYAYIKTDNMASLNSFRKAGFTSEAIVTEYGIKSYQLHKQSGS